MSETSYFFMQNLNKLAALVRGELPKLTRSTLCALITIDVHARDIITEMVNSKVPVYHMLFHLMLWFLLVVKFVMK